MTTMTQDELKALVGKAALAHVPRGAVVDRAADCAAGVRG